MEKSKYGIIQYLLDQNTAPYVSVMGRNGFQIIDANSSDLGKFLRWEHYEKTQKLLKEKEVENIAEIVKAFCDLEGFSVKLYNRTAWRDGEIYIDGIDEVYKVTASGWDQCEYSFPLFYRRRENLPLAKPNRGGDIKKILPFLNLQTEEDEILYLTNLVYGFVADRPHPIMVFFGPQGSAKTSGMKRTISILDPNVVSDIHSYSEIDFQIAAMQRWVIGQDNVSYIKNSMSDLLCKVVTGMSFSRRALYTNDEMITRSYNRIVLMNGINLPVDKPDLLDRCCLIALERIPDTARKDEKALEKEFELVRGEILGGCFDILSKAMGLLDSCPKSFKTRMVDYAQWGCAIAVAMGYSVDDFNRAIETNARRQNEEAIEASPLAAILLHYQMKMNVPFLKGSPTDVLKELRGVIDTSGIDPRQLPATPRSFGKKLTEIKSNLEAEGFKISFHRTGVRTWTIEFPNKSKVPSSASLPSS